MQRRIVTLISIASLILGSTATVSQADQGSTPTDTAEPVASATLSPESPQESPSVSVVAPDAPESSPQSTQSIEPVPSFDTAPSQTTAVPATSTDADAEMAEETTSVTPAVSEARVMSAKSAPLPSISAHPAVKLGSAVQIGHGWNPEGIIFPGDWDGNGHQDLMLRDDAGNLMFYSAINTVYFNQPVKIGHGWNDAVDILGGVDWTGDNHMDIVARFADGDLFLYTGNSSGAFTSTRKIGHGWQPFTQLTALARSKNGQPGLLAEESDGRTLLYPTKGSAVFLPPESVATNHDQLGVTTGVGDWDSNNYTDIAAVDPSGNLRYLAVGGNGTSLTHYRVGTSWNKMTAISSAQYATTSPNLLALRDDGKLFRYGVTTVPTFKTTTRSVTTAELGATWHSGCPVGAGGLRAISMSHWTPSGAIAQGTIIVRSNLTSQTIATFKAAFDKKFPITKMRPGAAYGGNDVNMMADDNTSAFNCRQVVGNPYRLSPHSYGYAFDINPYKNPYYAAGRWYPSSRYSTGRSASIPGMHMSTTVFPVEFKRRGGHWGFCYSDYHHFELTQPRC